MTVLFFDGECVLCNKAADWVAQQDTSAKLSFASLQETLAKEKLTHLPPSLDSIVLLNGDITFIKSKAVFEILRFLPRYKWLRFFRFIVPVSIADKLYDYFAANRLRWFGRQENCNLPSQELRNRYISG